MSNGFAVYPGKLKSNAADIGDLGDKLSTENKALEAIQAELKKDGSYGAVVAALAIIISNSEKNVQSVKKMEEVLYEAATLYVNTEKGIVSGEVDTERSHGGGGKSFDDDSEEDSEDGFWDYILEALAQAFGGDFTDESNILGTILSVIIGFTPVGLIADVRDLIADIYHLIDDGPETKEWVDLLFTTIGLIPGVGDFVKHADDLAPVLKNLDEIADGLAEATQGVIKNIDEIYSAVEDVVKQFNDVFDAKVVSKITDKIDELLEEVPDVKKAIDQVKEVFDISINKEGDTIGDFVSDLCEELSGIEDGVKDFITDTIDSIFGNDEASVGDATKTSGGFSCVAVA